MSGARGGLFWSEPGTVSVALWPETTEMDGISPTVGGSAAFTVTVVVSMSEPPQPLVAVSERFRVVVAATVGAVKVVVPAVASAMVPLSGVAQTRVGGGVPVALPARLTVPPEPTVYGPPALATGDGQDAAAGGPGHVGGVTPGHGSRRPTRVPPDDVKPPQARKGRDSKALGAGGQSGAASGKTYRPIR